MMHTAKHSGNARPPIFAEARYRSKYLQCRTFVGISPMATVERGSTLSPNCTRMSRLAVVFQESAKESARINSL